MRAFHIAILEAFLPVLLLAQTKPYNEPFLLVPPGISTQVERYEEMDPANLMQIRGFAADKRGFLWCWTNEGVARFDGYDVCVYRENLTDTMGMFKRRQLSIAVDGDGFVWMATLGAGLKRLDPATGQSRWYSGREDDSTSIGTRASKLIISSNGELWASASFGLAMYRRESDSFIRYGLPPEYHSVVPFPISDLCEIGRSIWVGLVGGGVAEFSRDNHNWKMIRHDATTGSGPTNDTVIAVCGDRGGVLWIGTLSGLDRFNPTANTWHHFSTSKKENIKIPSLPIRSIVEDDLGEIWIATDGDGIFRIHPATGTSTQYRHSDANPNSIPFNTVPSLCAPRSKQRTEPATASLQPSSSIVWIPNGSEPYRILVRKNPCTSVIINKKEGEFYPTVCPVLRDTSKTLWVGLYNGGIGRFDLKSHTVRWYSRTTPIWRLGRLHDRSIVGAGPGQLWMLDAKHDTFVRLAPDLYVHCFHEDKDSLLWLGCRTVKGMTYLAALDRLTGKYTIYPRQDADSGSHRDDIVVRICDDGRGALWYGTFGGGLIRFDRVQKTYRRFAGQAGSSTAPIANYVSSLVPDSNGTLWIGTLTGLDLMDCDHGTFEHMHSAHPTNELFIREMVDDGEGHLWIAAQQNAACFTKSTRTFRMLSVPEQFHSRGLWGVTYVPQSRIVTFGGEGGFFMFSIDNPPPASDPPPVVFTSFKVFEKPYPLDGEVWSLNSIILPHSASFFSVTFAALDYVNSAKNQYSYRLEGLEPDWVHAGSRRYVSYTNLDPGRYLLRVKGTNSEGIWNEEGASIEIIIQPPWYRTYWAYAVYLCSAGCLLYLLYSFDRRRTALRQSLQMKDFEAKKMHEVDQMKSRFFANISHEFRTPLTLILGPVDQLIGRFKDEETQSTLATMRRNGLRLLQLINQLLDLSKMDAGKMSIQVRPLDLVALARPLVMSFMSLAERKKIQLIFDPEEDEIIAYVDCDKIEKILTNLLSNAFKFTGDGGEIRVVLRILNDQGVQDGARKVEIVVSDTGVGIAAENIGRIFDRFYQVDSSHAVEHGGTGIGLALTKELVEIHKGKITVQSAPGRGSTFTVRLLIGKDHWSASEIVTDEVVQPSRDIQDPAAVVPEGALTEVKTPEGKPGKPVVMIVEDNADVRTYIRGFLQENYSILEAGDGKEALEKTHDTTIDLVISDITMPVMDGIALCKTLKNDDRTSHIPVILLTARASGEGKLEGLDIGADDYIIKPFDAWELMARAKNLIELRRKLQEKYERQVTLAPSQIQVTTVDERFLKKLTENIEQHIIDARYDTETLAHDMCMSRMQLNRKLQALTGHSTHEVVREFRLQRAAELLHHHADNVSGVAFEVGFNSLSHFARAFRERFGVLPSEYEAISHNESTRTDQAH